MMITFYEKPGCVNNTKQKQLLSEAGFEVNAHDLLNTPWEEEQLMRFFKELDVCEWFNWSAPTIKNGVIDPDTVDAEEAIEAMMNDPLLIRRPLMIIGEHYIVGFNQTLLNELLSTEALEPEQDLETCPRETAHLSACDEVA